jgi:ribosomal protein S18 acetylase RimI-like enzyme
MPKGYEQQCRPAVAVAEGTSADLHDACELWFLADEGPPVDEARRQAAIGQLAAEMLDLWQRPPVHLLVAKSADRLVGTVFGKSLRDDPLTGQISMLAVHPQWQRAGLGSRLMGTLLARLVDDGCVRCRMYVAEADREVQQFYERRGWAFTGQVETSPGTAMQERMYLREPLR